MTNFQRKQIVINCVQCQCIIFANKLLLQLRYALFLNSESSDQVAHILCGAKLDNKESSFTRCCMSPQSYSQVLASLDLSSLLVSLSRSAQIKSWWSNLSITIIVMILWAQQIFHVFPFTNNIKWVTCRVAYCSEPKIDVIWTITAQSIDNFKFGYFPEC